MRNETSAGGTVFNVLLIEDNVAQAGLIKKHLSLSSTPPFIVRHAANLETGVEFLSSDSDAILLDLSLPDSQGLKTFLRVRERAPEIPIIILTALDSEELGIEAVRHGAQDYLIKGKIQFGEIPRLLRYAIERNKTQAALRQLSMTDELTGLHNRRSFNLLAEQEKKKAFREKKNLFLTFIDIDGLKAINDTYGHYAGDRAIQGMAELLNETFRRSDIIARLGGDEFVVLSPEPSAEGAQSVTARLEAAKKNFQSRFSFDFSFSLGTTLCPFESPGRLEDLITEADRQMYRQKKAREAEKAAALSPDTKVHPKKTILIVEDDASIRKMLQARLVSADFEVVTAGDGEEGLALARKIRPDLILLDLRLPKLHGEEVCKAVREDHDKKFAGIPILMLTAKTADVDRVIGHVIGATLYMTKPFDGGEVVKAIRKLMRS